MSASSPSRAATDSRAEVHADDDAPGFHPTMMSTPRQCGRCRQLFRADPTLDHSAVPDWWLCRPCRVALLGDRHARTSVPSPESAARTLRAH
jgi:hypothetical protein